MKESIKSLRNISSGKFFPSWIIFSFCCAGLFEVFAQTSLVERFETTNGFSICDSASETPAVMPGSGYLWGGYSQASTSGWRANVNISGGHQRLELYANTNQDAAVSANYSGTYFYAVFDTNGTASASQALELTGMEADISGAAPEQEIRWLVRDANYDWYLSSATTVVSSATVAVDPSLVGWLKVDDSAALEMNELDADAKHAIAAPVTLVAGVPDLSAVTGGGLYIETGDTDDTTQYNFILTELRWTGLPAVVPETPDETEPDAVPVRVDVTRRRLINGQLDIIRKNLFSVHAGTSGFSAAQQEYVYEDLDVYAGRSFGVIWKMNQIKEDADRPGYWDLDQMNSQVVSASNSWVNAGSPAHDNTTDKITTSHTGTHFPSAEDIANAPPNGFRTWDHDANAEFVSKYIQMFYPRMTWYEFSNEINGEAGELGTTWSNICVLAKTVADRVHADNLGTKFVGFGGKWPAFEYQNFGIWNRDWVEFIDIAGASMDAYSVHLYSRMGPNAEAIMDMINNYSMIRLGETRPLMITEFGHLPDMEGSLNEKFWQNMRGQNSFFFQFLERGGLMGRSIPFNTANSTSWASAMLQDDGNGNYVWTDMIRLYEFWQDFRGARLEVSSGNSDVLVHALQDGNTVRWVIYNTLDSDVNVEPVYLTGDASILSAEISRLYWDGASDATKVSSSSFNFSEEDLTLSGYEAVMLTLNLSGTPSGQKENEKITYFGDAMILPIVGESPVRVTISGIDRNRNILNARLRISAGNVGAWIPSSLRVNGEPVSMPSNQMGDATDLLQAWEVDVPTAMLSETNVISVTYASSGGHLASAVMDVTYGDPLQRDLDGDGLSDDFEIRYAGEAEAMEPGADEFNDDLTALDEFAMGLNPREDNAANLPEFKFFSEVGDDYFGVTYRRASEAQPFVDIQVLHSTNLVEGAGWQTNQTAVIQSDPLMDGVEAVTERLLSPVSGSDADFLKVDVRTK
ncbi:hypothetical protein [Pontiella agarivorans]|uniref:Beta-porphyranase A C-terminal domain-containing protein n=1 Tax=Pontiella agarivorans TaxID=3038953 RepID=A0ABU5N1G8_9BACT|nr:hypothetical protein [Pontiella agarivorans]MDZ8120299.1 hypothetical protein [Pontiella agarivorans]